MSDIKLVEVSKMFSQPEKVDKYCMAVTEGTGDPSDLTELLKALTPPSSPVTTTPYAVTASDRHILVNDDTVGASTTVQLMDAATAGDGAEFRIKKIGDTANVVVTSADLIDGAISATLTFQYEQINVVSDGSTYHIF
jgi:hypothetical protein